MTIYTLTDRRGMVLGRFSKPEEAMVSLDEIGARFDRLAVDMWLGYSLGGALQYVLQREPEKDEDRSVLDDVARFEERS